MRSNDLHENNSAEDANSTIEVDMPEGTSRLSVLDGLSLSSIFDHQEQSFILSPDVLNGMENTRANSNVDFEQRTIVSSHPSEGSIVGPDPQFVVDKTQSILTTNTEIFELDAVDQMENGGETIFPSTSSNGLSHESIKSLSKGNQSGLALFEDGIFERIGAALSSDAKDCVIRLLSEPNARESSLPSIPLEVSSPGISASSINFQNSGYRAEVDLPPHLICGVCNDVVVGACILDCNCKSSVVCTPCWENRGRNQDDSKSNRCPSCQSNAELKAYCHALDAAILHIIESLPADSEDTITLKQGYYARLSDWRPAVSDRNDRQTRMVHVENELSTRRSREENADRKHPPKKKATAFMRFSRASLKVIATVFAPLIAAAAALVALKIKRKMIR